MPTPSQHTHEATQSASPKDCILGDDTPRSMGHKQKNVERNNLVDFVKDFNHDYLERVNVQERDKHI